MSRLFKRVDDPKDTPTTPGLPGFSILVSPTWFLWRSRHRADSTRFLGTTRCKSFLTGGKGEFFDMKIGEFDDAYYNIRSQKKLPNMVILSLALPQSVDLPQVSIAPSLPSQRPKRSQDDRH